jgi:ABC-type uncharacterized transport system fused permease/ATPase subunit
MIISMYVYFLGFDNLCLHRTLTSRLALGWRIRLTNHLLQYYLRRNAFYKVYPVSALVFKLSPSDAREWLSVRLSLLMRSGQGFGQLMSLGVHEIWLWNKSACQTELTLWILSFD